MNWRRRWYKKKRKAKSEEKKDYRSKRQKNKDGVAVLSVGDTVKVKKTNEIGVVDKFIVYGTGDVGEVYDYTSIQVFFENESRHKRYRRYSGNSLEKI